eukprot:augustus_masked-scaffold_1-processed-gene-14.40-mRNA-1 protein AED:1.00 eAED:1.00 QI:0/0/0/0/1/1/2/0/672
MEEGLFKTIDTQREKYEASTTGKITLSSAEQKNNGKAMAIVLGKISNNMLEKVEACEDIYSMWKKLENLFKVDDREERRRSFEVLEHPRGSTRVARIEDFDTNLSRFVTAGGLMHEDQKIARLLNVIKHDRVTQLKIVVEDNPEVYNYDKVFNKLLHLSNILDRIKPILGRNARGSRARGRGGYRNANPQQKCYNCGERGHIRARCTKLICENCKGIRHEADECRKPKMNTEYRANMAEKKQQYESQNDFYNDHDSVTTSRTEKKTMYSNKSVNLAILNIEKEKNQNKNQIIEENQNKKQENTKKQNKNYINFLWDSGASSHLISMDKIKHVKDIEKIEGETLDGVASTTKLNLKGNMTVKLGKLEIDLKDVYIIDTEKPVAIISIGKVSTDNDIKTEIDGKGINIKTSNGERIERIEANQNLYKKNLEVIKQKKDKKNKVTYIDTKIKNKIKPKNKFGRYIGKSRLLSESKILDNVSKQIILSRDIRTLGRSSTNIKHNNKKGNNEENSKTEREKSRIDPPSKYQDFLNIRKEDDVELPEHWQQRRNPQRAARPITYKLAKKTSNYKLAEKLHRMKIPYHAVYKAANLKNNKEPRNLRQAFKSKDKTKWLEAYMKEVDKFKKIAQCRLVKREHAPANITPIRFMEIFNKKFDNVNHENIFKVRFAANGKHL